MWTTIQVAHIALTTLRVANIPTGATSAGSITRGHSEGLNTPPPPGNEYPDHVSGRAREPVGGDQHLTKARRGFPRQQHRVSHHPLRRRRELRHQVVVDRVRLGLRLGGLTLVHGQPESGGEVTELAPSRAMICSSPEDQHHRRHVVVAGADCRPCASERGDQPAHLRQLWLVLHAHRTDVAAS